MASSSLAGPVDVDQTVPRSAEYLVVPIRWRIDHEPRIPYPANKLADRDLSLKARERTAETEVDAAAVAKVLVILAVEIDLVWIREPVWVAVSRPIHPDNRPTLWNGRSRNLNVFKGGAGGPELDRRFEAQELFDPGHDQLRPAAQLLEGIGVVQPGGGDPAHCRWLAG